jgi:hypothetical protein
MAVAVTGGKPEGPIAKPEHVLLEPVVVTPRTTAITAMAYSPWTSLIALAAPKQILLYDTDTRQLVGIFPYTEGYARSLQFSRNGSLLVMGGGRAGKNGHAIVWDVKTGKRITEVGKEFDQVMSADISPDHKHIVIGSPSKKVKVLQHRHRRGRIRHQQAHRVDSEHQVQPRWRPARHQRPQRQRHGLGSRKRR